MLVKGAFGFFVSLLSFASAAPYGNGSLIVASTFNDISLSPRDGSATSLDFSTSQWIWTGEEDGPGGDAPVSTRAFRKTVTSPSGKNFVSANIIITADNEYTLYVNGQLQGTGSNFQAAQAYTVAVQPEVNLFAVAATNAGLQAGLIATILMQYNDGTSQTYVTDSSWKTFVGNPPADFQDLGTDDTAWPQAVTQGSVPISPWGDVSLPPALDISQSHWIWTSEATSPGIDVPPSTRAFRKTIVSPSGKRAVYVQIVISADNEFTLFLNGDVIGSGTNWQTPQFFSATLTVNPDSNLFAIEATNILLNDSDPNSPAGVIATILIAYDDGTTETFITDSTWKTLPDTLPCGFQFADTDDSDWNSATNEGFYGVGPWGLITVPDA